jgi:hypothetical protein
MSENKECQPTNAIIVEPAVVVLCLFRQVQHLEVVRSATGSSEADILEPNSRQCYRCDEAAAGLAQPFESFAQRDKKEWRDYACAETFARFDVVFDTLNSFPEEPGRALDCRRSRTEHGIANLILFAGLYRKVVLVDDLQSIAPRFVITLLDVQYRTQSSGSKK